MASHLQGDGSGAGQGAFTQRFNALCRSCIHNARHCPRGAQQHPAPQLHSLVPALAGASSVGVARGAAQLQGSSNGCVRTRRRANLPPLAHLPASYPGHTPYPHLPATAAFRPADAPLAARALAQGVSLAVACGTQVGARAAALPPADRAHASITGAAGGVASLNAECANVIVAGWAPLPARS